MTWLALGGAAVLQLVAGIIRVRAWFHVIRHSCPDAAELGYRDVALAHLGGAGWNAVLPARAGDAVKVGLVARRIPERPQATVASTLAPPGLVEAVITALLLVGFLGTHSVPLRSFAHTLPAADTGFLLASAVCMGLVAAVAFRRRLKQLVADLRSGVAVLSQPRILGSRVLPWLLAARVVRLLSFALVLTAAGVPFGFGPALALMALQGATPSAGVAVTAARMTLLAAVLAGTGAADVSSSHLAAVLAAAYGTSSALNLAVSAAVIAWLLRTVSPRRVLSHARSAMATARPRSAGQSWASPLPADATSSGALHGAGGPIPPQPP